jgi:hypothetical protein
MDLLSWLNRSWPIWRTRGLTVRVSLWLLIVAGLFALQGAQAFGFAWLPAAAAMAVAAMVIHALAHVAAVRLVHGQISETTASALVEQASPFIPPRPWPVFASAIAGPLANGLVAVGAWQAAAHAPAWLQPALALTLWANAGVALLNCLACSPFDGRLFWRGLLWPLLGLRRASAATIGLGYLSAGLLLLWGAYSTDLLAVLMGLMCLFSTITDHRVFRSGLEPALDLVPDRPQPSFWDRWSRRRAAAAQARQERQEADEQEVLDRLLAKVSAEGLPSLTAGERATLQRISQRQKERAGR